MPLYLYTSDETLVFPALPVTEDTVAAYTLTKGDVIEAYKNPDEGRFTDAPKKATAVEPDADRVPPVDAADTTAVTDTPTPDAAPPTADVAPQPTPGR